MDKIALVYRLQCNTEQYNAAMQAPYLVRYVALVLETVPSPTETWAEIIKSIAWPVVVVFLVLRFRMYLRNILNTLVDRLATDHVKLGWFELTPNSQVLVLDPNVDEASSDFTIDDLGAIEALFEFIASPAGEAKLQEWLESEFGADVDMVEFLTEPYYADGRATAKAELLGTDT